MIRIFLQPRTSSSPKSWSEHSVVAYRSYVDISWYIYWAFLYEYENRSNRHAQWIILSNIVDSWFVGANTSQLIRDSCIIHNNVFKISTFHHMYWVAAALLVFNTGQYGTPFNDHFFENMLLMIFLIWLDRSLMIGWRKIWKILKPWKGVLCIHFRVCLSVCLSPSYIAHLLA